MTKLLSFISNPAKRAKRQRTVKRAARRAAKRKGAKISPVSGKWVKANRVLHEVQAYKRKSGPVIAHDRNPKPVMAKRKNRKSGKSRKGYRKNPVNALAALNPRKQRRKGRKGRKGYRRNPAGSLFLGGFQRLPWKDYGLLGLGIAGGVFVVPKILGNELEADSLINKLPGMQSKELVPATATAAAVKGPAHELVPSAYKTGAGVLLGYLVRQYAHQKLGEGIIVGSIGSGAVDVINYAKTKMDTTAGMRSLRSPSAMRRIQPAAAFASSQKAFNGLAALGNRVSAWS